MALSSQTHRKRTRRAPNELPLESRQPTNNPSNTLHPSSQAPQYQTLYIPIEPPPTPAPSPPLIDATLPPMQTSGGQSTSPASDGDAQDPAIRHQYILSFLNSCTPEELLFISQTVTPLLKRDFMSYLPPELALYVLSFIDEPKTLTRASRVSKNWYRIVRDETVWRRMCYIHDFDDWDQAEVEALQERQGKKSRKRKEEENTHADGGRDASSHRTHRRSSKSFSFRRHFKRSYIIRTNWRKGGELLNSYRLPIFRPDNGTVTSVALDSDWVVVGFASNMIKVFSAHSGVLSRTLVGHDTGVWGVCLVSKGGHRIPAPDGQLTFGSAGASDLYRETGSTERAPIKTVNGANLKQRKGDLDEDEVSRPSSSLSESFSTLNLDKSRDGTHVMPSESLEHLVPLAMQKALGLDLLEGIDSSDVEPDNGRSSEEIFSEYPPHGQRDSPQRDFSHNYGQDRRKGKQRVVAAPEEQRDVEELYSHVQPINMSASSQGWGQPNSIVVSGGCDKTLRVWDAKSGQCIYVLHGHTATIRCIRVLNNRPTAVTGSRDGALRVWDVQLGRCLRVLEGHHQSVRCLDVCGNKVVSGSYDSTCRLWNIDTGECLHVLQGHLHEVYSVAFDGDKIASGGLDTTVRVWDAETGQCIALLQGHSSLVCQIQLSLATNILATGGSDGRVITFSLSNYKPLHRLAAHDSSVTSLQFDKDFLVTGGNDGRVKLYETQTGNFVRELSEPSENVWKVAYVKDLCAVMCKRAGKTVVEIWSLRPTNGKKGRRSRRTAEGEPGAGVVPSPSSRSS